MVSCKRRLGVEVFEQLPLALRIPGGSIVSFLQLGQLQPSATVGWIFVRRNR
jgi:hypothetical protein